MSRYLQCSSARLFTLPYRKTHLSDELVRMALVTYILSPRQVRCDPNENDILNMDKAYRFTAKQVIVLNSINYHSNFTSFSIDIHTSARNWLRLA